MKHLKTILREIEDSPDEFEDLCDAERRREISRRTYFRACAKLGVTRQEAEEWLRESYQRAGVGHLF